MDSAARAARLSWASEPAGAAGDADALVEGGDASGSPPQAATPVRSRAVAGRSIERGRTAPFSPPRAVSPRQPSACRACRSLPARPEAGFWDRLSGPGPVAATVVAI